MNPLRHPFIQKLIPDIVSRVRDGISFQDAKTAVIVSRRRRIFTHLRFHEAHEVHRALNEKAALLFHPPR